MMTLMTTWENLSYPWDLVPQATWHATGGVAAGCFHGMHWGGKIELKGMILHLFYTFFSYGAKALTWKCVGRSLAIQLTVSSRICSSYVSPVDGDGTHHPPLTSQLISPV